MPKGPKGRRERPDPLLTRPERKRLNAEQRRMLKVEAIRLYETKAGRQAQKGREPNDRHHDRDVERAVSLMGPAALARLLSEDEEQ